MKHVESKLQIECIKWFRLQYRDKLIFAIPNGGRRGIIEATIMKKEGVLAGIPDLCIPVASFGYHALYIEMKTETGKLTESQKNIHKLIYFLAFVTKKVIFVCFYSKLQGSCLEKEQEEYSKPRGHWF